MPRFMFSRCSIAILSLIAAGCGGGPAPAPKSEAASTPLPAAKAVLLEAEPSNAQSVGEAKTSVADGAEVTLVGRIGGAEDPWVEGRAAFTIVDLKLKPCQPDEGCPTPWDYCCATDQLAAHRALVKVVDAGGQTVEQNAKTFLGVKELQTVVVKGTAKKDEAGNLTVLAAGVFVRPETK